MQLSGAITANLTACDVLVVGGGPAGSTISTLLAQQGWQVHLREKDPHPRFHIVYSFTCTEVKGIAVKFQ